MINFKNLIFPGGENFILRLRPIFLRKNSTIVPRNLVHPVFHVFPPVSPFACVFPACSSSFIFFSLRVLFHLFLFLLLLFLFINVLTKHSKTRRRYRRTEEKQLIRIIRSLVTDSVSLQFFFFCSPRESGSVSSLPFLFIK